MDWQSGSHHRLQLEIKQVIYIGDLFYFYYILDVQYLDWVVKQEQTVQKGLPQKTVTKLYLLLLSCLKS